jgi:hypothetical protein
MAKKIPRFTQSLKSQAPETVFENEKFVLSICIAIVFDLEIGREAHGNLFA